MDDGLGRGFWLKFVGLLLLGAIAAILVFVLIADAWYRWGFFGGILVVGALLLGVAYISDRRSQKRYEDLPES